jgi:hypothetical protein
MSRRGWTLIGVLVVLCGLIGSTLLATRPKPAPAAADNRIQLLKGDKEKLVKVELTGRAQADLTLLRSGKTWTFVPPGPAWFVFDESNLDRLLTGISTLFADRLIDEKPTDLAQYGLTPPKAIATGTFIDGAVQTVYLGDRAPGSGTYYLQVKGNPRVYTVQMYDAEHFKWAANDLRSKVITPALNYDEVTYLRLVERNGTVIEANEKTAEENKSYQLGFGKFLLTRPYPFPRGIDTEKQDQLLKAPQGIAIESIVADAPADMTRYGLARPWGEAQVRDKANAITFLFGAQKNDTETYFMIKGQHTVYSVLTSSLSFMDTKPFDIVDKFIFIPNIDEVDRMDITVAGVKHVLAITRTVQKAANAGEEDKVTPSYSMDGKPAKEEYFKGFYQSVIGLMADGEVRRQVPDVPDVTVRFTMNKGPSKTVTLDYAPYDRDFYAIFMDGKSVFALTRGQMDVMRTKLDLLLKGEPVRG